MDFTTKLYKNQLIKTGLNSFWKIIAKNIIFKTEI